MGLKSLAAAICVIAGMAGTANAAEGFRLLVLEGLHVKWGRPVLGSSATVTYAFLTRERTSVGARNCAKMVPFPILAARSGFAEARLRHEVAQSFRTWERAAALRFAEIGDPEQADIVIGADGIPQGRAFANVELAPRLENAAVGVAVIGQSLICLNPLERWKIGFDGNLKVYDLRYTFTHEIGHAIGLDHPGPKGALMGYRYDEKSRGLQPGDIEAARMLYGTQWPVSASVMADPPG